MKFSGIKITAPKKDIYSPVKKYENQLLSSNNILIEAKAGRGESSASVYHNRNGVLPIALSSTIDSNGKRHALLLEDIDQQRLVITTKKFYRIFVNEQTLVS